ncbi:hypothetical protein IFM89_033768, partial [Coptis chinensis]
MEDVEEVKVLVKILPIFACTIMFNLSSPNIHLLSGTSGDNGHKGWILEGKQIENRDGNISLANLIGTGGFAKILFLGSADLFTLAGLLEFFFTEAPARIRSLAMALSWASLAMGYYLSSVLVLVVSSIT